MYGRSANELEGSPIAMSQAGESTPTPAPRRAIRRPVELTFEDSERAQAAETRNLSVTGMLVLSDLASRPGRFLRFDLDELSGTGEVIWTRTHPSGRTLIGIRFVSMSSDGRGALARLVRAP